MLLRNAIGNVTVMQKLQSMFKENFNIKKSLINEGKILPKKFSKLHSSTIISF